MRGTGRGWLAAAAVALAAVPAPGQDAPAPGSVWFATFHASLNRETAGGLVRDLDRRVF